MPQSSESCPGSKSSSMSLSSSHSRDKQTDDFARPASPGNVTGDGVEDMPSKFFKEISHIQGN